MRFTPLAALVSVLAVATCTPVERGAVAPPSGPAFAHVQDLDGTPDMIVDAKTLATSWVVYDQELKESFCSIEVKPYNEDAPPKSWVYRACGRPARPDLGLPEVPGNQGISVGYADEYYKWLGGQYFVLNDPNAPLIQPGRYTLRIWVNPPF